MKLYITVSGANGTSGEHIVGNGQQAGINFLSISGSVQSINQKDPLRRLEGQKVVIDDSKDLSMHMIKSRMGFWHK